MVWAAEDEVVEVCGAVVLPPGADVVGVAPGGGAVTGGEPAVAVPES